MTERNLTPEEQKKYTESISKVYKPTGANIHTDNTETLQNALKRIEELEVQIDKMKCCENCKHNRPVVTVNETIGNNCEHFFNGCNNNSLLGLLNWEME